MSKKYESTFRFQGLNDRDIFIENYFNSYSSGFSETSKIYIDGMYRGEAKCCYINRSWQQFSYQCSAAKVVREIIDGQTKRARAEFLEENGAKRWSKRFSDSDLEAYIVNFWPELVDLRYVLRCINEGHLAVNYSWEARA